MLSRILKDKLRKHVTQRLNGLFENPIIHLTEPPIRDIKQVGKWGLLKA
jgi:hypothetical protein